MKIDRKGEGGFMESIFAVMAVTISLTAFLVAIPSAFDDTKEDKIPTEILNSVSIKDGDIVFDIDIEKTLSEKGYVGSRLTIRIIGTDNVYEFKFGERDSDDIVYASGTFVLNTDGKKMNATYELAVWK